MTDIKVKPTLFDRMLWARDDVGPRLRWTERYVLNMLILRMNPQGICWPSIDLIAADTGLCRRTVINCLQVLEREKALEIDRSKGHNTYRIGAYHALDGASPALDSASHAPEAVQETRQEAIPIVDLVRSSRANKKSGKDSSEKGKGETMVGEKKPYLARDVKPREYSPKSQHMKLAHVWRTLVPECHPEVKMVATFKQMEIAQFKKIAQVIGPEVVGVVGKLIEDWASFAVYVKSEVGLSKVPSLPSIGFVLKYAQEGLTWSGKSQVVTLKSQNAKPKPLKLSKPKLPGMKE